MALGLPRGWLRDTAALYARVFRRGAGLALRNWWVGLVVIVYDVLLGIVAVVTAPLGVVGALLTYLALVACFSSWLALVAQVIQTGHPARRRADELRDLPRRSPQRGLRLLGAPAQLDLRPGAGLVRAV